ncbi:MAG: phosphoethanolamine transferase [Archangiaceae bacterium]|nr:phosphoethanolamine transferase [Archangiaceae bacterium]
MSSPAPRRSFAELRTAALRRAWELRWLILVNLYLFSPVVLDRLRNSGTSDVPPLLVLFTFSASLGWLWLYQLLIKRPFVAHALLLPFYILVAVDLYVIFNLDTRLSSSVLSIMMENFGDWRDFVQANSVRVFGMIIPIFTAYGFVMLKLRPLELKPPKWLWVLPVAGLTAVYGAVRIASNDFIHLAAHDRNTPFGVFPQGYLALSVYREVMSQAERTKSFSFGARRTDAPREPEVYVVVLGESSRPHNWGLYGYERPTTPKLSAMSDLLVYRDMVSQASYTKASVPLILTRGSAKEPDRAANEKSIVTAYKEAGFHTWWLSTQHRDPFTGAINRYSNEAQEQRFVERQHDEALLSMLDTALGEGAATGGKQLIVVHTMGSHFTYTNRYPREFATWEDGKKQSERDQLKNSYDNSILYTDFIVSQVIDKVRATGTLSAVLYLSDHGDNMKDDDRQLFGHFFSNEFDLPIPMVLWLSPKFVARYPQKAEAAKAAVRMPLNTESIFHSLAELASIDLHDANAPLRSVFSPELKPVTRLVITDSGTVDYETRRPKQKDAP